MLIVKTGFPGGLAVAAQVSASLVLEARVHPVRVTQALLRFIFRGAAVAEVAEVLVGQEAKCFGMALL